MSTLVRSRQVTLVTAILVSAGLAAGCQGPITAVEPVLESVLLAKGGNGGSGDGSGGAGASVIPGDLAPEAGDAPALASTCPSAGGFGPNAWAVVFGKSLCLIVAPLWRSTQYQPYELRDDILLNIRLEKGKNGRITHIRLAGQDVDGPDGVWHETDWIELAGPVVPTTAGFTLHVHARNVQVWRTDSHLGGGNRIEMIGLVSFGDVVYPPQ